MAIDSSGNLYVADNGNHLIRKITPNGTIGIFAGQAGVQGYADGTGINAQFTYPSGLAFDNSGNLYVADGGNSTVRKITPDGTVSTLSRPAAG